MKLPTWRNAAPKQRYDGILLGGIPFELPNIRIAFKTSARGPIRQVSPVGFSWAGSKDAASSSMSRIPHQWVVGRSRWETHISQVIPRKGLEEPYPYAGVNELALSDVTCRERSRGFFVLPPAFPSYSIPYFWQAAM